MVEKTSKKTVKKTPSKTNKKVVAAKTKKSTTTKKVAIKSQEEKKDTTKATKSVSKKPTKKVEKKTTTTKKVDVKHPSENTKLVNKDTSHKTLAIVTGIIVLLLGLTYVSMTSDSVNSLFSTEKVFVEHQGNTVIIIEDSSCEICQVDEFIAGIKAEIDPTTQIIRLEYSDESAQEFIEANDLNQVPIVIFSKSFDQLDVWEQLSVAFSSISYNEVDFYLLSYNTPQIKLALEEPQINDQVITFGNQESETIIYEFCSYEVALCALVNNNDEYLQEVKQYNPEYVSLYPQVEDEAKIVTIHVPQEENLDAYVAAYCANEQNKYEPFRKALYDNQFEWVPLQDRNTLFTNYALQIGIDQELFSTCLEDKREMYLEQLVYETSLAQEFSVAQVPTFIVDSYVVQGPLDYSSYQTIMLG